MPSNLNPVPSVSKETHGEDHVAWSAWLTNARDMINKGKTPTVETPIASGGSIPISTSIVRVISNTSGNVNAVLGLGYDGQQIDIEGLSDVKTVTLVDGSGIKLVGGVSMVLGQYDSIRLIFNKNSNLWIERNRTNH